MALVVKDRVKETTATTGTGTLTLAGAVSGFQTFASALSNADTTYYAIREDSTGEWEVGLGTFTASGTLLSRDTILESSNAGSAINLTVGSAEVFITYPAEKSVYLDASGDVTSAAGQIDISNFNNDSGFTTNTGTVTSVAASAGTGINISGSPITTSGTLTITNTAPDQTVVLTQGSNVTITGTYPNFTIASTDTNTTYSAGNGIGLTGTTFSVAAGGGLTQDANGLSHTDTSSQSSVNNSNGTVIQDVTLDTYGHVTALGSVDLDTRYYTESEIDTKLTDGTVTKINNNWSNAAGNLTGYVNDGGGNLGFRFNATPGATNTLVENGIAYRFDVSNDSTTGDLVLFRGSTASGTAGQTISWTEALAIDGGTNVLRGFGQTIWTAGNDGSGSGLDADTLDGVEGANYLRSDTSDTMNGTLTIGDGTGQSVIEIKKADNNASDHIQFYNGTTRVGEIGVEDTSWLRINQETATNIYTPRMIRADGGFQVDAKQVISADGDTVTTTNVVPASDNTGAVGTSALTWANGQFTNLTIDGTLSVRAAIDLADNDILRLGSSDDWEFFHNGTHNYMDLNVGDLIIRDTTTTRFTFSRTSGNLTLTGIGIAESFQEDYDALSGTTPAPDADNAGAFSLTTSGNTTFTFGSVTSGRSVGFILELTAGGTHTITWPASVEWAGGSAPDAPASGETDIYVFWTRDGGTTWYGIQSVDAAA